MTTVRESDEKGSIGNQDNPASSNDQKIETLRFELDYRRTKQWNIFSWCSAALVALIGSISVFNRAILPFDRRILCFAVAGLTVFACLWLTYNADREKRTATCLEDLTRSELGAKEHKIDMLSKYCGHRIALALLATAALFVIWYH